eukprot:GFUD01083032.1.p1 GENE.GFUD01083032.1~~GFUD01083032.1.p1  ORF type:complete len:272 (+),score=54.00 GFUD01083032.1:251-1066(+)
MRIQASLSFFALCLLLPLCSCMDADNGNGNILRGLPCVMRLNQLVCSSAGNIYPDGSISTFIDDNKALLRRMYGEIQIPRPAVTKTTVKIVRTLGAQSFVLAPLIQGHFASAPIFQRFKRGVLEGTFEELVDNLADDEDNSFKDKRAASNETASTRSKRQAQIPDIPDQDNTKADVCESKTEVTSPFWESNSNGKVRAILNNKEFEQAVHQEICTKPSTLRCNRDCSCEQKYKWHRLLAYDPNNDCSGIFMDWFLFPSCCACRCNKNPFLS